MLRGKAGVSRGHSSSSHGNEGLDAENGKGPMGSSAALNPTGRADGRRAIDKPHLEEDLLERILSRPNMLKAWEWVKANKGAPGRP